MSRLLVELEWRANLFPRCASWELRAKCIEIARQRLPSPTFKLANQEARFAGVSVWEAMQVAKAARWLAMIRRTHGDQEFENAVKRLTA